MMVFRLCGHSSAGPSGVADQSSERMRAPISPPPERKSDLLPVACSIGHCAVEMAAASLSLNCASAWLIAAGNAAAPEQPPAEGT